jgi:hypothetical protein
MINLKKTNLIILFLLFSIFCYSHNIDYGNVILKKWEINKKMQISASFLFMKNNEVYLQIADNKTVHYPINSFSANEQIFIKSRYEATHVFNSENDAVYSNQVDKSRNLDYTKYILVFVILLLLIGVAFYYSPKSKRNFVSYFAVTGLLAIINSFIFSSCSKNNNSTYTSLTNVPTNLVATLTSQFNSYSNVTTSSDNNYFYVASNGIPTSHDMMKNITAWIAQVPTPQPYIGSNAWSIPLQPVLSSSPISISGNFQKGAIAIAVNGIPIFNPINASGLISKDIGELDDYGGHCGRADDYHYHTAPLHLETVAGLKPIAYALDGFAVYGSKEPDGVSMLTLDLYHGHEWNGNYHYHGTITYPFMIGSMRGKVTLDPNTTAPETQIIPQAKTIAFRNPPHGINGNNLIITACTPNSNKNGYTLAYTIGGVHGSVVYSWTAANYCTFIFNDVDGKQTTEYFQR